MSDSCAPTLDQYMPLIYREAAICFNRSASPKPIDYDDLIQEGVLCFFEFVKVYDPERASFITGFYIRLKNRFARMCQYSYRWRRCATVDPETMETRTCEPIPVEKDYRTSDIFFATPSRLAFLIAKAILDETSKFWEYCQKHYKTQRTSYRQAIKKFWGLTNGEAERVFNEIKLKLDRDAFDRLTTCQLGNYTQLTA